MWKEWISHFYVSNNVSLLHSVYINWADFTQLFAVLLPFELNHYRRLGRASTQYNTIVPRNTKLWRFLNFQYVGSQPSWIVTFNTSDQRLSSLIVWSSLDVAYFILQKFANCQFTPQNLEFWRVFETSFCTRIYCDYSHFWKFILHKVV